MTISSLATLVLILFLGTVTPEVTDEQPNQMSARRTDRPPKIDGDLSDPAWKLAKPYGDFVQNWPDPNKPPTFQTVTRILYDDDALYIAFHCHDPEPKKIVAPVTRRDRWLEADWVEVAIDSRHDHRTAFWFSLNPAGVQRDGTWFNEDDASDVWDGVWEGKARVVEDGWEAEMRIPLRLLRFRAGKNVTFGLKFNRWISRLAEGSIWPFIEPDCGLQVSRWGNLVGLDMVKQPVRLDLTPYLAVRSNLSSDFDDEPIRPFDLGVDGKAAIGSNFNLTWTLNPDFGQVEVDQVVLNLSTIETFYPEKRPFFLEDMSLFQTPDLGGPGGSTTMFYTRRIGRSPRYPDTEDDEEIVRPPQLPRIYGALKFVGETEGRFSVGLLQALTSKEDALLVDSAYREFGRLAEPLTSFSILRLKQDFWDHSSVGLIATSTATHQEGVTVTGGTDLQMELFGGDYKLGVLSFVSYLSDGREKWQDSYTQAAIEADGPVGYGGQLTFAKTAGEYLLGSINGFYYSPNLALNDLGYMERGDRAFVSANLKHRRLKPIGPVARYYVSVQGWVDRSARGVNLGDGLNMDSEIHFKNNWGGGLWLFSGFPLCDDRETRSEGRVSLCGQDHRWRGGAWIYADSRKMVTGWLDFGWHTKEHGHKFAVSLTLQAKPQARLQLDLTPRYIRSRGSVRWIDTEEDVAGDRYLFADQNVEGWDVTFRGTFTFSPEISLQAYAQVFMLGVDHVAKYAPPTVGDDDVHVGDLVEVFDIDDDYDYTSTSLNISAVLRWEYLPGSVAYLVYTGAFGDSLEIPEFRFGSMLDDLFKSDALHVLLLKISYLWG
jgi:uncharacterized protein DUF5916/cellulose/xylan binding protein with CBM9 domain